MIEIKNIHLSWWNKDLVVVEFNRIEGLVPMLAFYDVKEEKIVEYNYDEFFDNGILNETTGEYEYCPVEEIKMSAAAEKYLLEAIRSFLAIG